MTNILDEICRNKRKEVEISIEEAKTAKKLPTYGGRRRASITRRESSIEDNGESEILKESNQTVSLRGGLPIDSLKEIKIIKGKRRTLALDFEERPLIIEATSAEQYSFLLEGFSLLVSYNFDGTLK